MPEHTCKFSRNAIGVSSKPGLPSPADEALRLSCCCELVRDRSKGIIAVRTVSSGVHQRDANAGKVRHACILQWIFEGRTSARTNSIKEQEKT